MPLERQTAVRGRNPKKETREHHEHFMKLLPAIREEIMNVMYGAVFLNPEGITLKQLCDDARITFDKRYINRVLYRMLAKEHVIRTVREGESAPYWRLSPHMCVGLTYVDKEAGLTFKYYHEGKFNKCIVKTQE